MSDGAESAKTLTLVFTDLADSTALKTARGDQTVGGLIAQHRVHVEQLAAEAGGRIIGWAGDGCFLTFEAPSAAVLFALRLERAHGEDTTLPGVRIGIHMGEVSERTNREGHAQVEGLAVDLASRICGLARPGQVLLSAAVADSVRPRLDATATGQPIRWQPHGSYRLKGISRQWNTAVGLTLMELVVFVFTRLFVRFQTGSVGTLSSDRVVIEPNVLLGIALPGPKGTYALDRFSAVRVEFRSGPVSPDVQGGGPNELVWLVGNPGTPDIVLALTHDGAGRALGREFGALLKLPVEEVGAPKEIRL